MMKYVFILFPVLLIAQPNSDILFLQNYQKATVLNGTNQTWTKSSPTNLDFSGISFSIIAIAKGSTNFRPITAYYSKGIILGTGGSGVARLIVDDGTNSCTATGATITDGNWHLIVVSYTYNSAGTVYVDGVAGTPVTNTLVTGSLVPTRPFEVGGSVTSTAFWNGSIASVQWIKGYALTNAEIQQLNATWRRSGLRSVYGGGQIVAWYDWQSGGTDKSGSGNHLTPVNNPIIVNAK